MSRKTIDVETVKQMANFKLLETADDMVEGRNAVIVMVEQVLHVTGNYRGFQYLNSNDMLGSGFGTSVGIQTDSTGQYLPADAGRFEGVDRTRVRYY